MTEYTRDTRFGRLITNSAESVVLPAWVVAEIDRLRTERDDARLDNMMLRGLLEHHGITIA
jgi:hypothetical protein